MTTNDKPIIGYNIQYIPGAYDVRELHRAGSNVAGVYYGIHERATGNMVGFTFDANFAKTICLALDLVLAQVNGDTAKALSIMRTVERLKQ